MIPNDVKETLQKNLISLRKKRGLSQTEVERKLGLPRCSVHKIEHGLKNPSWYELYLLSRFYCVSMDDICQQCISSDADTQLPPAVPQETERLIEQLEQVYLLLEQHHYHYKPAL